MDNNVQWMDIMDINTNKYFVSASVYFVLCPGNGAGGAQQCCCSECRKYGVSLSEPEERM